MSDPAHSTTSSSTMTKADANAMAEARKDAARRIVGETVADEAAAVSVFHAWRMRNLKAKFSKQVVEILAEVDRDERRREAAEAEARAAREMVEKLKLEIQRMRGDDAEPSGSIDRTMRERAESERDEALTRAHGEAVRSGMMRERMLVHVHRLRRRAQMAAVISRWSRAVGFRRRRTDEEERNSHRRTWLVPDETIDDEVQAPGGTAPATKPKRIGGGFKGPSPPGILGQALEQQEREKRVAAKRARRGTSAATQPPQAPQVRLTRKGVVVLPLAGERKEPAAAVAGTMAIADTRRTASASGAVHSSGGDRATKKDTDVRAWLSTELDGVKAALQNEVRDLRELLLSAKEDEDGKAKCATVVPTRSSGCGGGGESTKRDKTRAAGAAAVAGAASPSAAAAAAASRLHNLTRVSEGLLATFRNVGLNVPVPKSAEPLASPSGQIPVVKASEAAVDTGKVLVKQASASSGKPPFSTRPGHEEVRGSAPAVKRTPLGGHNLGAVTHRARAGKKG